MPAGNDETITLAHEIMKYFELHPNAADSADGILEWWLGQQALVRRPEDVSRALDYLCGTGEVIKTHGKSGNVIYSSAMRCAH